MSDDNPMVDIVNVYSDAYQITARELAVGMYLFDAFGGRYRIANVRGEKRIYTTRADGVRDAWHPDETVTVADTDGAS